MTDKIECHGLDTPERVCFYEQEFYVLSNFSSFQLRWRGETFATSEHAYHWSRFQARPPILIVGIPPRPDPDDVPWRLAAAATLADLVRTAPSAHEAFKIAQKGKEFQRPDWDKLKVAVMRQILIAKVDQHEYVHRKLQATGERELVENSWRDDYWGCGPNGAGQNMLGKLWMEVRTGMRARHAARPA